MSKNQKNQKKKKKLTLRWKIILFVFLPFLLNKCPIEKKDKK